MLELEKVTKTWVQRISFYDVDSLQRLEFAIDQLQLNVAESIQVSEEKIRARIEAERKAKEEVERKRKAEEERLKKEEEEKRRQEEEKQRKIQEEKVRKEEEEKTRVERENAEKIKKEQENNSSAIRQSSGLPSAEDLWSSGLQTLHVRRLISSV